MKHWKLKTDSERDILKHREEDMISLVHLVQPAADGVFDFAAGSSGFFAATIRE